MPLNKELIGREFAPATKDVTVEALQNYARAYNDDNPAYFDTRRSDGIIAPPMFAVVVSWDALMQAVTNSELRADLLRLVHGEQDMEFIRPMVPGDLLRSIAKIISIETKATGETCVVEVTSTDGGGKPVSRILFSAFVRGGGNRKAAPEAREPEPARGAPDFEVVQKIDADQTYRYAEASGDRNPIHVDENVAKMAGLPGIIVHGLCTMAFTSKVIIDNACGHDPAKLKRLRVRFSRPVRPGETITTRVWNDGARDGRRVLAFETFNPAGQAVIRAGLAEVAG